MKVESGDNVLIGGFIVTGSGQKTTLIRALGPSVPVSGTLSDPILELHDATGAIVATKDNWRTSQQDAIIATGAAPTNDLESAIIATLSPGNYTAIVRGVGTVTGVALVEVYDLDSGNAPARLGNISTRGEVLTGEAVMIGGFIVRGDISKRMIVRAVGPSLNTSGVPMAGRLLDPMLQLHDGTGALIAQNDNWRSTQSGEIQASTIAPRDDREPTIVATLAPGSYTVVVRGVGDTSGIALIEVYDLDQPPQPDGSTLYVSQLRPQSGASTQAYGSATLRLADDGLSASISFDYTNLTGPLTGMHVHGPGGQILFDLDEATPRADGTYLWTFVPVGIFTIADIATFIRSGQTYLNLHTAAYPSGEISAVANFGARSGVAYRLGWTHR